MGKRGIFVLLMLSFQGWAQEREAPDKPVFEQSILSKAAEKRIFSDDKAQRVKDIETFVARKPATKINLINDLSPARNQGQRGACSNFASMALIEHLIDKSANYSEQCLAYFSKSDDGGTIESKLDFILSQGIYREADCPYQLPEEYNEWPAANEKERDQIALKARNTMPSLSAIKKLSLSFHVIKKHVDDLSDRGYLIYIQNQLNNKIPVGASVVSVGSEWSDNNGMILNIPGPEIIEKECKERGQSLTASSGEYPFKKCDSHAIVLTGYDDAKKLIYFKNSWNDDWGLDQNMELPSNNKPKGYGAFSYAYLTKFRINNLVTLAR